MTQNPLVQHGQHFGQFVYAFCNIQTLITNGLLLMDDKEEQESLTAV